MSHCIKKENKNSCCSKIAIAKLGHKVKPLSLKAMNTKKEFYDWNIEDNYKNNKWTVINFYPADFTFVCPTEIKGISNLANEFKKANAEVLVASVDSLFAHKKWVESELGSINIPMLSDSDHKVSKYFNIYSSTKGLAWRGTYIISPEGVLYVSYSTFAEVGRSAKEILRLLHAAQVSHRGELPPCEWQPGQQTLKRG